MFNQLDRAHSLYIIQQEQLEQFKKLVVTWKYTLLDVDPLSLNKMDAWALVLNSWLFLKSHPNNLILNPSKAIHYSINTFLIEELERFPVIQKIIKSNDDDLFYIVAFQLGKTLDLWVYNVLNTTDTDDILHRTIRLEYFLAHSSKDYATTDAVFHLDQTRAVKKIAHAVRTQNCFWLTVHNAVHQSLDIYQAHATT